MSGGFSNPLVGGGGALVFPSVHSPNYVLAVSGWAIRKDGTAQFTGLVLIGGTFTGTNFVINNSGAFFYSGAPATGNLIASIANAGGTDSHSNTFYAGICSYLNVASVPKSIVQILNGSVNTGTPAQIALTGGASPGFFQTPPGNPGEVEIDSGLTAAGDVDALFSLFSKNANNSINTVAQAMAILSAPLNVNQIPTPLQPLDGPALWGNTNGFWNARPDATIGDTGVYQVGQVTFRNTADQTGISGQTTINGLSHPGLGIGLYRISGVITVVNTSVGAGTLTVGISGPALANVRVAGEWYSATNNVFKAAAEITAQGGRIGSVGNFANSEIGYFKFDGILNVAAAGAFSLTAGVGTATTMTAKAFSYVTYTPVN